MTKKEKIDKLIKIMSELLYLEYENTNENELDSLIVKLRVTLETLKELKGVDKD